MSFTLSDRVQETTTTAGTGTITLAGAVAQCRSFSAGIGTGNTTYYTLLSGDGSSWEVGIGAVGGSGPYTLARTTVLDGSNGTSPVSLTGTSIVFCDLPASATGAGPFGPLVLPVPTQANTGLLTWINQGSATLTQAPNGLAMTQPGHSGDTWSLLSLSAPNAPYAFSGVLSFTTSVANYTQAGVGWYNSANGNMQMLEIGWNGALQATVEEWNSPTSYNSTNASGTWLSNLLGFKIRDDGTNVYFDTSADGSAFNNIYTIAKSSGFLGGTGYNTLVWGIDANTNSVSSVLMGWRLSAS